MSISTRFSSRVQRAYHHLITWIKDENGTTAVEYAVMIALIAAVCIASVNVMTSAAKTSFEDSGNAISN